MTDKKQKGSSKPVKLITVTAEKIQQDKLIELKKNLQDLHENMFILKEHMRLIAELTRAKYEALLKEGFSEKQALKLSKHL